jgi:hypothetical protein
VRRRTEIGVAPRCAGTGIGVAPRWGGTGIGVAPRWGGTDRRRASASGARVTAMPPSPVPEGARARRRAPPTRFRPNFLLVLFYVGALGMAFALAFALPALVHGAAELPPGPAGRLSTEELALAREIARDALDGRRLAAAFLAAAACVGLGIWTRRLPGFRG